MGRATLWVLSLLWGCGGAKVVPAVVQSDNPCEFTGAEGKYVEHLVVPNSHAIMTNSLAGRDNQNLTPILEAFYEKHDDVFDFLVLFVPNSSGNRAAGIYHQVGLERAWEVNGASPSVPELHKIAPNLDGVLIMATNKQGHFGGPVLHELAHEFGVYIKPFWGREQVSPHWKMTSVDGNLGGFEADSLSCFSPVGEMPPNCDEVKPGRFEVLVDSFGYNANDAGNGYYAPLELYMFGLLPPEEVPPTLILKDGVQVKERSSSIQYTMEVSAVETVTIEEILELNGGARPMVPIGERTRRAAFVLVTEDKTDTDGLDRIRELAMGYGGVERFTPLSYCMATRGLAKLRTDL